MDILPIQGIFRVYTLSIYTVYLIYNSTQTILVHLQLAIYNF